MKNKYLECDNGNKSSKRLNAAILLYVGIGMAIITFAVALSRHDYNTVLDIIGLMLCLGTGLSGVTIFDRILNRRKNAKV